MSVETPRLTGERLAEIKARAEAATSNDVHDLLREVEALRKDVEHYRHIAELYEPSAPRVSPPGAIVARRMALRAAGKLR